MDRNVNSLSNLRSLLSERSRKKNDIDKLDSLIYSIFNKSRAILFIDLSGYTRNIVDHGLLHALHIVMASRDLFGVVINHNRGAVIKTEGDSVLAIFDNCADALNASMTIVSRCIDYNAGAPTSSYIMPCIGISYGDVFVVDNDVYGQEVNIACKLGEDLASPYDIYVTEAVKNNAAPEYNFIEKTHSLPIRECVYMISHK